ncbi:MAG: hypothetical protein J6W10_01890, partial [Kiritimatiellae bacterium]|nr:hypothetical protein [Kiritimatiellia bacterium]
MKSYISSFFALIYSFTAFAEREVTNLSVSVADDGSATATVEFTAGEEGDAHVLYYVWSNDGVDKGDDLAAWPHVLRVNRVADDATGFAFALPPAAAVTPVYSSRVFLADSKKAYDYLIDSVYVSNASKDENCYVDTGYKPAGGRSRVTMDLSLAAAGLDASQYYVFGANYTFSFCAYINGNGFWAFSCNNGTGSWSKPTGMTASKERVRVTLDSTVKPAVFTVVGASGTVALESA